MHWIVNLKKASLMLAFAAALAVLGAASGARAATIKWGRVTDVSGKTDVSTTGTLVSAYSFTVASNPTSPVVNGVKFTGLSAADTRKSVTFGGDTIASSGGMSSYGHYGAPPTFSSAYQTLLTSAYYSSVGTDPLILTLNKLTPGREYQFEAWVNDARGLASSRTEKISGKVGNSVTLAYHKGTAGAGQFVLGTFTADSTGHQAITFTGIGNTGAQINAFQLRALPEPKNRKQAKKVIHVSEVALPPAHFPDTSGFALTADMSHPATSTFILGRPVGLVFRVRVRMISNWTTNIAGPNLCFGFCHIFRPYV